MFISWDSCCFKEKKKWKGWLHFLVLTLVVETFIPTSVSRWALRLQIHQYRGYNRYWNLWNRFVSLTRNLVIEWNLRITLTQTTKPIILKQNSVIEITILYEFDLIKPTISLLCFETIMNHRSGVLTKRFL